jgi:hypothetical protein
MIYDAVMIFNIFQKVSLPSYVDLFTFTAPSKSTADANVNTEYDSYNIPSKTKRYNRLGSDVR